MQGPVRLEAVVVNNLSGMALFPITIDNYPEVARIYQEGMATGFATFETSAPTWEAWDASHHNFGRIVARENDHVLGWAALSPTSKRYVYRGVAEVSIYVASTARGRGVGTTLLQTLIELSEENNIWTLQSGIFPQNKASITMHERCGFRMIGYRERIAMRDGDWHDNVLLERRSNKAGVK